MPARERRLCACVASLVLLALHVGIPAVGAQDLPEAPRMPGEFEPQEAVAISSAQMLQFHPETLVDLVTALHEETRVVCLAGSVEERRAVGELLLGSGLPAGCVFFVYTPVMTMWVRDFGPFTVLDAAGAPWFLDPHYGTQRANKVDDGVPGHLGEALGVPVAALPLTLEGGDLLSNGRGFCISSQHIITRNERERGYDLDTTWGILQRYLGFRDWFPSLSLEGEPTGHVDMFLTFTAPDVVVVGRYDPAVDAANARRLDWVARALRDRTWNGGQLRVERIPMPPHDDGRWRTYTNVVYAGGVLLVPTYPGFCPELDAEALAVYRRLLPDRKVVGVDASSLIERNGALHCVTANLPVVGEGLR